MKFRKYRVLFGDDTLPPAERIFPTQRAAESFARRRRRLGDRIFSFARLTPGADPQSPTVATELEMR